MKMKNFIEELRWRGMLHDMMPGTEELLNSEMVTGYHLSRRQLLDFLKTHFHFNIGFGTVFNKEKIVNEILVVPTQEIKEEIHKSWFGKNRRFLGFSI